MILPSAIGFKTLLLVGLVGALGTIAAGGVGYFKGYDSGAEAKLNELTATWEKQQRIQMRQYADRLEQAQDELEAMRIADQAKDAKHEQDTLDNDRRSAALIAGLQQRATRAERAAVPASGQAAAAPACCTGAQLCREDGAFLVGEAARGRQLQIDLERCQGPEPVAEGGRGDH